MKTAEFDYDLPQDRIAQEPLADRDASRLLVLERRSGAVRHARFPDLPTLLAPGDVVVVNDTRVLPARVALRRATGGRVGSLFVRPAGSHGLWLVLLEAGGRLRPGETLSSEAGGTGVDLVESRGAGEWVVRVRTEDVAGFLREAGKTPLPPYVRRAREGDPRDAGDRDRYQTIFADPSRAGAVAAPTAGLHFSERVVAALAARGIGLARVTLHVGPGTFRPMQSEDVESHRVDPERFHVSSAAAEAVRAARARGARVVAVGTTTVRALETAAAATGEVEAGEGETALFIREPFPFRAVDAMVTNFHLPRSSLLVLVAAFAGRDRVLAAYSEAVREGYRFYSYGDAMLVI